MRIRIYTDGACSGNPGPGGWAMVVNTENQCKHYSGYDISTTNNRMELMAVVQCLRRILEHGSNSDVYEIYSDSAYVVNSINNRWLDRWNAGGWKTQKGEDIKNRDLWEQANCYLVEVTNAGQRVKFIKVKGHAGNTFNELVDKLAKEQSSKAQALLGK